MKPLLTTLCTLMISSIVIAQPTLTGATINPVVGNKFYIHDCNTAAVSSGASGAGVSWSYPGLSEISLDSTLYSACVGTPYCDSFPGSTLASNDGSAFYDYFITNATQFSISGNGAPGGNSIYYPDPQALLKYPMSYGVVMLDTYISIQPLYSFYSRAVDSIIADAWGTLVIPSGTYSNTLRVHYISYERDSDMSLHTVIDSFRSENYAWYTPGFHNPLLTMSYDTSGGGTPVLSDVAYYTTSVSGPSQISNVNDKAEIWIYPNPAKDMLHLKLTGNDVATITVMDAAGRELAAPVQVAGSCDYNTSSLAVGVYLLRIQTGTDAVTKRFVVAR